MSVARVLLLAGILLPSTSCLTRQVWSERDPHRPEYRHFADIRARDRYVAANRDRYVETLGRVVVLEKAPDRRRRDWTVRICSLPVTALLDTTAYIVAVAASAWCWVLPGTHGWTFENPP